MFLNYILLDNKSMENENAELVLNTIATINNLSFYNVKGSSVLERQLQVSQSKIQNMMF